MNINKCKDCPIVNTNLPDFCETFYKNLTDLCQKCTHENEISNIYCYGCLCETKCTFELKKD